MAFKLYSHNGHEHEGNQTVPLCSPPHSETVTPLCFHTLLAVRVRGHSGKFAHTSP